MSNIQIIQHNLPAAPDQFALAYSPGKCLRLFGKIDSPVLCMESSAPSLARVKKQYSDDFIIAYIALWIDNLNDFVNAVRKMNPVQIEETAILILQEYYYFNIADINLVFRKIKKGEFGQLFAELDGVKILSWFEQYARERARNAADLSVGSAGVFNKELPRWNDGSETIKNKQAIGLHLLEKAKCSI